ncbi:hypothetical protein [Nitrospirillum iridis]|uniref:DUF2946 domain-containing protein n=1 Tax=Nitrospirillum iridis TaxID=765888 RepID=A0A7X0B2E6_9PROT|nr:hypothetical protein [Nitrospirillum iridis]MBB6253766.1 hypothetical protein [Nitrospirillum iridis]
MSPHFPSPLSAAMAAALRFLDLGRARRAPRGWAWVLVAAVLLRGLIPVGYMANTSGGAAPFMLCPGVHDLLDRVMAAAPMAESGMAATPGAHTHHHHPAVGADGLTSPDPASPHDHRPGGDQDHMGPCAFAALAALAIPVLLLILALPPRRVRQTWRPGPRLPHPVSRLPGTPGARAPPLAA